MMLLQHRNCTTNWSALLTMRAPLFGLFLACLPPLGAEREGEREREIHRRKASKVSCDNGSDKQTHGGNNEMLIAPAETIHRQTMEITKQHW